MARTARERAYSRAMMAAFVMRETTLPEREDHPESGPPPQNSLLLVVAWCGDEPWRVGEVLLMPVGSPGPTVWFGRGPSLPDRPPKSPLGQLRPGTWLPSPPLGTPAISRYQLSVQALGPERLALRNEGRCTLLVNEAPVDSAEIVAGDRVQLGKQLLFVCAQRTVGGASGEPAPADFPYGRADASGIVGESSAIWELRRQLAAVTTRPGHVLVTGPTGSGKELVAQAIHALSPRAALPLVARNAATLPEGLIDAELFGNAKNYPNPGMPERKGLVGEADGSTLFLDELAELPHTAQAHLLRVLDAGEYQRLGEPRARTSDFRLIAATNRELGSFKHDLLARFTFRIAVPGLEPRKDDLPLLVGHLLRTSPDFGAPGPDEPAVQGEPAVELRVIRRLLRHRYQAGLRELRSLLWQELMNPSDSQTSAVDDVPGEPAAASAGAAGGAKGSHLPTAEQVQRCLDQNNGVLEQTWRALGLNNRFALLRLIKRYDLEVRRRPARR
jgi:two-component system nitrogen regulation response regulator GlnG/two-component system response regulator HydG